MSANIKVRYTNTVVDPDVHFTFDAIYQVLSTSVDSGTVFLVVLNDVGKLQGVTTGQPNSHFELVSVTYPGDVQIYP